MRGDAFLPSTEPHLLGTLAELLEMEPIFHTSAFARTEEEFDRRLAPGYWEIGASGNRYSRDLILAMLKESLPLQASSQGWQTSGHALQQLGPSTYLLTYTLDQRPRLTRRATVWQATLHGWQILYHQGTLVAPEDDE